MEDTAQPPPPKRDATVTLSITAPPTGSEKVVLTPFTVTCATDAPSLQHKLTLSYVNPPQVVGTPDTFTPGTSPVNRSATLPTCAPGTLFYLELALTNSSTPVTGDRKITVKAKAMGPPPPPPASGA